jgi:hypothetical protein
MTTDPNPTPAVLAFLADRVRHDANGAPYFLDDAGSTILDSDSPDYPTADARAVARWTRTHRPELWGETAKPAPATSSAADMMARVRTGTLSVADATAALLAQQTPETTQTPAKPAAPQTVSELMAAVRRGTPGAAAALERRLAGSL